MGAGREEGARDEGVRVEVAGCEGVGAEGWGAEEGLQAGKLGVECAGVDEEGVEGCVRLWAWRGGRGRGERTKEGGCGFDVGFWGFERGWSWV